MKDNIMNIILPIITSNQHYKFSNKQQKTQISFTGGKELFTKTAAVAITSIAAADVVISKSKNSNENNYKDRLQTLQEKLVSLTESRLSSDYLLTQCRKQMLYMDDNTSRNYGNFNRSEFTPKSIELVEQFVENEPLYTNENLCNGVMDKIVSRLFAIRYSYSKNANIEMQEAAGKVKLISDAYINNPDCQKSEPMKKNIAFLMYRAIDANDEIINQAIEMMSNPDLYNDEEYVSHITYKMKKNMSAQVKNSKLNKRIDKAKEKMDSIDSYRFFDMRLGNLGLANEYEINGLNIGIVEKFLNEDRLRNNPLWESEILTILSSLNTMIYGGTGNIHDVNAKIKQINSCIDGFLTDETDRPEDEKAQKYIDGITYY